MLNDLDGKGLLIHHWDTDGICSARLILEHLKDKELDNVTPILGNYFLTEEELAKYEKYDFVIVVDMSLPKDNILRLAKNAKLTIIDHHLGEVIKTVNHQNPIIKGKDPNKYPSASWIVNDYLGNQLNLFAILGIIGDHEQKIKDNPEFISKINSFCEKHNISFDELLKMAYLMDTNYKLGNKEAVEQAPRLLFEIGTPQGILTYEVWNQNYKKINEEIQVLLDGPQDEINGIIYKKINTPYNIISTITRKIAWERGKNILVVNTGFFADKDQIYMRSKKSAEPMIQRGKELGFKCGGKKEVLGAIVPKGESDSFVIEIIDFLNGRN